MHIEQWRRPGCLAMVVMAAVAIVGAVVVGGVVAVALGEPTPSLWVVMAVFCLAVWAQVRLFRRITTRRIPICPHCGVRTDPRFRICRSCGRVKDEPVSP